MSARPNLELQVPESVRDAAHDFDFLHGSWTMHNLRLTRRLAGAREWVEFDSANDCHPLPGGIGNQDVYRTDYWPDFVGMTVRLYNPANELWSLYWVDNRSQPGMLQPPVVGGFDGNVGIFEGDDEFNGAPIRVRFTWTVIDAEHLRWEQAFSPDAGATWETNWFMNFTRRPAQESKAVQS